MSKEGEAKIILGIDPGIADTGFGVIAKNAQGVLRCLDYGSIKTSARTSLSDRLEILSQALTKIIKDYQPDLVSVEELFFSKNVKTALIVGHARGVILLTARQQNVPVTEFTPLQVKQAVSSYGKAPKAQVQRMVMMLLGLKKMPQPDDAADALAVAICACNESNI